MFDKSVMYTQENLDKAWELVHLMEGNMGKSELTKPLETILKHEPYEDVPRTIIIISCGKRKSLNFIFSKQPVRKYYEKNLIFEFFDPNNFFSQYHPTI